MADAEPEAEDGSEDGGGGRAAPGQSGSVARVAPLGPEQLRRVLEQVTKAQPPAEPPPPPFVLQDAARRLRDAAQQAALQRGPGAEPPRPPRLLPPQFLHQCDQEDLVELALPQLAQVVTVYEFLLMKVERGHLAKPFFPAVYKEFEELHNMVKKMCQDYLHSSGPCLQEPLEINNNKVAESLGITEEFLRKRETRTDCVPPKCASREMDREGPGEAGRRKRGNQTTEEGLASVKRTRRETLPQDTEPSANIGGQQRPALWVPAASEGFGPGVNGRTSHLADDSPPRPASERDGSTAHTGQRLTAFADLAAGSGSADPAPWCRDVSGLGAPALGWVAAVPENTQEHWTDAATGDSLRSWRLCSSSTSAGGVGSLLPGGSGSAEAGNLCEVHDSHVTSPGEVLLAQAAAPPLDKVLSLDIGPADHACGSVSEPGPQLCPEGGLGGHVGDLDQLPCGTETHTDQAELEHVAAVGEAVAFEVTNGCHELPQGQERIFIQTPDGLILPHPGPVVPVEGDTVIVANAEGPALQTGRLEGVPPDSGEASLHSEVGSVLQS
ncbi:zinc finger protein 839 isoform X2 [Vicugna pacos]|uniref:Zinc finger protein 839 isoform X2 n=1 Tax=Vicugna pacos TaxID=30538 RepID=A0ABM5DG34_VICPA